MHPDLSSIIESREHVLDRLRTALIRQLRLHQAPDELDPDTPLFGSGLALDSLDAVEIIVCLEQEFGLRLGDDAPSASRMRTLNTIANLVLAAQAGAK